MLRILRRGQRWITAIFIVAVGFVFVLFVGLGGPLTGPAAGTVVAVGPLRFGVSEFLRTRANLDARYREIMGEQYDSDALTQVLDEQTARTLVDQGLMTLEAEQLGLTVGKAEIQDTVRNAAIFADSAGRFDPKRFKDWAEYEFGSEGSFIRAQRQSMLADKMRRLLYEQAHVSEGEARDAARQQLEEVRIAFARIDAQAAPEGFEPDPAALARLLASRAEEVRGLYEARAGRYNRPERARARHILLSIAPEADEEEIAARRADAEALRARLIEGADFAELAAERSDDPGSREQGGDLGFFQRGQMVAPFEEYAFSAELGALSEPIRTEYGFHLIRVEERHAAERVPFEEVREELAAELLGREAGRESALALAERLAAGVREGKSLEEVVRAEQRTLERSSWLRRRTDGYVPELGSAPELLATAFALEPGASSPRIFEVGGRLALVQVLERRGPSPEELEIQVAQVREEMLENERAALPSAWIDARRNALIDDRKLVVNLDAIRSR